MPHLRCIEGKVRQILERGDGIVSEEPFSLCNLTDFLLSGETGDAEAGYENCLLRVDIPFKAAKEDAVHMTIKAYSVGTSGL